jgi:prevent-host-death family protein
MAHPLEAAFGRLLFWVLNSRSPAQPSERVKPARNTLLEDRKRSKFGPMKYSSRIKPISYVKANAAELIRELAEKREPLVITQNGEAKAVMQDVASYEATQETLALLKILALGNRQIEEGKVTTAAEAFRRMRGKSTRR